MSSIYTVALTAGLFVAVPVLAAPQPTTPVDPQVIQMVKDLHQTVLLLHEANHDYDGHRAKAMHEIHQAMHALHPKHHHKAPTAKPAAKTPPTAEDQKVSDAQLTKALQNLQTIQPLLASSTAANHQKAALCVQAAMGEIKTALSIK